MKQIFIVHGFGEKPDGNLTGMQTLGDKIQDAVPSAVIKHFAQDELDAVKIDPSKGPVILIGRSWGGSAVYRYADRNPDVRISLAVLFDPVPNCFKKPRQWVCKEWTRRKNIDFVLTFNETMSLLKGDMIETTEPVYMTDNNGVKTRSTSWFLEHSLPDDPKVQDFFEHFAISKTEWCVKEAVERIASL